MEDVEEIDLLPDIFYEGDSNKCQTYITDLKDQISSPHM